MLKQGSALDRYFKITERGSNLSREVRGGFATFFAMSYIVVLNPLILSGPDSAGTTLGFTAVAAVTAFVASSSAVIAPAVTTWCGCRRLPSHWPPAWASTPSWPSRLPPTRA